MKRELYKIFNNKMAGMLMAKGFVLIELRNNDKTNKNVYMFRLSDELLESVKEIKNLM